MFFTISLSRSLFPSLCFLLLNALHKNLEHVIILFFRHDSTRLPTPPPSSPPIPTCLPLIYLFDLQLELELELQRAPQMELDPLCRVLGILVTSLPCSPPSPCLSPCLSSFYDILLFLLLLSCLVVPHVLPVSLLFLVPHK